MSSRKKAKTYLEQLQILKDRGLIEPSSDWSNRLFKQLQSLDEKFLLHMGFPTDWPNRPLWQTLSKAS